MNIIIGNILFLTTLGTFISFYSTLAVFWSWKVFIFIVFSSFSMLMIRKKPSEILEWNLEVKECLIDILHKVAIIGVIIGLIQILMDVFSPENLGRSVSISLLSIFYTQIITLYLDEKKQSSFNSFIALGAVLSIFLVIIRLFPVDF